MFKRALDSMTHFYASLTGVHVFQLKTIPPRPAYYDGRLMLFGTPRRPLTPSSEDNLRRELERYGAVVELNVTHHPEHDPFGYANVRYETHATAARALAGLKTAGRAADFEYNDSAYDVATTTRTVKQPAPDARRVDGGGGNPSVADDEWPELVPQDNRGTFSGWCTFEQGVSLTASAHLSALKRQSLRRYQPLPEKFALAQHHRPKLTDISGDATRVRHVKEEPGRVLARTVADVDGAKFVGAGDKIVVQALLHRIDWLMKTAMEEAELAQQVSDRALDPLMQRRILREERAHAHEASLVRMPSMEVPPSARPTQRDEPSAIAAAVERPVGLAALRRRSSAAARGSRRASSSWLDGVPAAAARAGRGDAPEDAGGR